MHVDTNDLMKSKEDALRFLHDCVRNGLARSFDTIEKKWVKAYPEVTGYLLSLFCKEPNVDFQTDVIAKRLVAIQRPCGGFKSFGGGRDVYVFDTSQICLGLLDWYLITKSDVALRTCLLGAEFIQKMQLPNGAFFPIFDEKFSERVCKGTSWGDSFSPINCKCVELLTRLTEVYPGSVYGNIVERTCNWTLGQPQLLYSHPGAYSLEGLLAGGHELEVRSRLEQHFLPRIEENGYLPYHPDIPYAYVSGSVQIGLLCARLGLIDPALRIYHWANKVQGFHSSGGLFQYANADGSPNLSIHGEINSWGTKYYVELLNTISAKNNGIFPASSC